VAQTHTPHDGRGLMILISMRAVGRNWSSWTTWNWRGENGMCHGGVFCAVRYESHLFLSLFLQTNIWLWNLIHMLVVFFFHKH